MAVAKKRKTIYRLFGFAPSDISRLKSRAAETAESNQSRLLRNLIRRGKITKGDQRELDRDEREGV